jgi:hypothetical protein
MQLPDRDIAVRVGLTLVGGSAALVWNKFTPISARGHGYIPPAALAALLIMSDNCGPTEKDIASALLGYSLAAQAVSYANPNPVRPNPMGGHSPSSSTEITYANGEDALELEAKKLKKIRAVTGTLGALTQLVNTFRGQ